MKKLTLPLAAVLTLLGCNCRDMQPAGTVPDFVPTPTALSFSACPTRDENNLAVAGVFPDTKKLSITNQGRVDGELALTLSGAGASSFTLGSGLPTSIARLGDVEIPISFSPTAKGDVRADLTIDDKTDSTENRVVTLIGSGINLPAQPSIETAPQKKDASGFLTCTADSPISECTLDFPDTLMDQSATLQLKIRNRGCPALKVTAIEIDGSTTPGTNDGFTLDSPSSSPSEGSPILLSTADGTDETTITIRFTATDDGSGSSSQSHYAVLTLKSNDPVIGDGAANPARLTIQANAIKPSIYVSPTSCNFTNAQDVCGNATRIQNKANFRVTNDGSTPIAISGVRFRSSGGTTSSDSRFSITQNVAGQMIQPTASATIEVTEVDQPLLVSDQLEIVADIPGMGAGSGGTVVVSVISGIKPCLTTDPMDEVDFGDPSEELTAKLITIRNGASCGTLKIDSLSIRHLSAAEFFTFIEPIVPPNTSLPAGGSVQATVQYRRPTSGGMQLAELKIATNDTDYGAPNYKQLLLRSNAALDQIPQAGITACQPAQLVNDPNCVMGAQTSASFNLSMINPDEITFSGATSTDNGMVREYRFTLLPPIPGGATSAALQNNGMRTMTDKVKLTIPPGVTGTFRIGLEVWDDRGQKSANTDVITVNIYP
ncbi:MAG: choice-of-anchor D domain-containing protein [Archangium sp.]|nr:choice-of-anchor D domain-containing protein [Archangium sp.]MDP3155465.1 choice-of-anchor D domain-containing protein [Archangium sp.]MDP3573797.1 choice-of-anchor D domain-containing protein [Archangium sp.]